MARTTLMGRNVEHAHEADRQDTPMAAEARVSLKLAAEGYSASRFGADAGGRLTAAATFALRGRALHYYGQLNRINLSGRLPEDLRSLHEHPLVDQAFANLQVAAMAYSGTRGGCDAHSEYTRAAIGELCAAAVFYVEILLKIGDLGASKRESRRAQPTPPALGEGE
jgi:hypothetical protein